jgi:hypothetical protein
MSLTRQQRRYLERQELKAARQQGREVKPAIPEPKQFWTKTRAILAAGASIVTIASGMFLFWPAMDIFAPAWESSVDPGNARFQFKNIGRITIRDVRFDCLINTPTNQNLRTSQNKSDAPLIGEKSQIIGDLAPEQFVSRDCFGGAPVKTGGHPSNIRIDASFLWPAINHRVPISRYFVSETDGNRVWMTPEKEPKT